MNGMHGVQPSDAIPENDIDPNGAKATENIQYD